MSRNRKAPSVQTVNQEEYREEYRRLDNRVTCILQQRWPANEVSQWVTMLQGKQQAVACAILRHRHPRPALLNLPAIGYELQNPFQAKASRPAVPCRCSRTMAALWASAILWKGSPQWPSTRAAPSGAPPQAAPSG